MDNTIDYIKIEDIIPSKLEPHQSNNDDDLEALAISIQNYGIIQPLLLRKNGEKYEIVLGNRRYKAATNIGLKQVPAIVLKLNDKEVAEYTLLDNLQRKDLNTKEIDTIYQNIYTKYNIDREYISSNLGIILKSSEPQSNLLTKEEGFKSNTNSHTIHKINTDSDVIKLSDLNQEELEREDSIMNNEILNNNIINTNINPTQETNQTNNTVPTFGGRFFPSLEDEQTNMNMNQNITTQPEQPTTETSPLIDLTDLGTNQIPNSNPQLEPVPNFANPTLDNLNQPTPAVEIPTFNSSVQVEPTQPTQIEVPQVEIPSIGDTTSAQAPFEVPQTPEVSIPQPEMPSLEGVQSAPIEVPQMGETPQVEIPTFNSSMQVEPAQPTPIEVPQAPEVSVSQPETPSMNVIQEPLPEKKDITPAINTIKSLVDTISSLGYNLNINENDLGTTYSINIEIQK